MADMDKREAAGHPKAGDQLIWSDKQGGSDKQADGEARGYAVFRSDVYALLGALLARPPSDDLLAWLRELEPESDSISALTAAWQGLRRAAGEFDAAAVAEEFQLLFVGLGRGELVPFGSWYQSGFLMERPLVKLRSDLSSLGLERNEGVKEPEDHVAALCDVMAILVHPEEGVDPQRACGFFADHLQPWGARFFNDLQVASSARFYRAVGLLGARFLEQEAQYLDLPP